MRRPATVHRDYAPACSRTELMVVAAARALRDGEVVFVGIGLPNLACNLAKRLHAPGLELIYESGIFGAAPERQALSIGDPCLVSGAAGVCSLPDIFLFYLQRGLIDVGFLGAAQIDRFGNINSTVIGPYNRPTRCACQAAAAPRTSRLSPGGSSSSAGRRSGRSSTAWTSSRARDTRRTENARTARTAPARSSRSPISASTASIAQPAKWRCNTFIRTSRSRTFRPRPAGRSGITTRSARRRRRRPRSCVCCGKSWNPKG